MIITISPCWPGFAAKVETKKVWILNSMIKFTFGLFINRGASAEGREQINQIIARQKKVEENPDFSPLCIYPEGT
jgi:1-acyl-sn-glycerol-3-phosphate acyltransferase